MRRALTIAVPSLVGVFLAGATGGKLPSTIALALFLVGLNVAVVRLRLSSVRGTEDDDTALAMPLALCWLVITIAPNHSFILRSNQEATSSLSVESLIEVLYCMGIGLFAIWIIRRLDPTLNRLSFPFAMFAYPMWALVSMFWSFMAPYSLGRGCQMMAFGLLAWATASLGARFPKTLDTMVRLYLRWLVRAVLILIGLGIAFGPVFAPTGGDNLERFTWIGAHPNASGLMMAMAVVILASTSTRVLGMPPVLRLAALAAAGWAMYGNNSRTSLVCLVAGLFVCLVLGARRSPLVRFGVTPYAASIAVIGAFVLRDQLLDYFYRGQDSDTVSSGNGRLGLWSDGYALLRTSFDWLFGLGFGTPRVVFQTPEKYWARSAHNSFLSILVSLGIIGIACLTLFLAVTAYRVARSRIAATEYGPPILGLLAVAIVNAYAADTLAEPNIGYALVLFGWAVATATIGSSRMLDPPPTHSSTTSDDEPAKLPIRAT